MKPHVLVGFVGVFVGALTVLSAMWPVVGLVAGAVGTASTLGAAYLLSQGE